MENSQGSAWHLAKSFPNSETSLISQLVAEILSPCWTFSFLTGEWSMDFTMLPKSYQGDVLTGLG